MAEPDTEKLRKIIAEIDVMLGDGVEHADVIAHLVADHDGKLNTTSHTYTLRLAGVTGTCTYSASTGLLASWRRNAEKRTGPGRNTDDGNVQGTDDRLRLLVERIERLEEEEKGLKDDKRDVYSEAKAVGYDAKIIRKIIRIRKMKPDDRREEEMLLDTYKCALGID
ncbi:uncharacterized protein (UPF0335 family) [Novosphingobium sp. ST904]|nr:uncharacterized protein (UPF0335 family) [Novosphingobium sp. ST904]